MKKKIIIIIGSGGHAKVLIDVLQLTEQNVIGATDRDAAKKGSSFCGVSVLGDDDVIKNFKPDEVVLVNAIGSVKDMKPRKAIYEKFKSWGYSFLSVIHPSSVVARDVRLAEGVQVMAGAIIQPGSSIGENSIINTRASIDHDCKIGSHVHIAPGVTLSGSVVIGDQVHVGTGSSVIQGVVVGEKSTIGAGSTLLRNVAGGVTVIKFGEVL